MRVDDLIMGVKMGVDIAEINELSMYMSFDG